MNPIPLTKQGTNEVILYACGRCGHVHNPRIYSGPKDKALPFAEFQATKCCETNVCKDCGAKLRHRRERFRTRCVVCSTKPRQEPSEILDEIPDGYNGMFYWNGEYYQDLEYLECDYDPEDMPEYVYLTTACKFRPLDIGDMLDNHLEGDLPDNCDSACDLLSGFDELYDAVKKFNETNAGVVISYFQDHKRAVRVPKPEAVTDV